MGFHDLFHLSAHAVITDARDCVLQLRAAYGGGGWGLPGGALEPGETVLDALRRECEEELGCEVEILYLSGAYYHAAYNSHALIFRCRLPEGAVPRLSAEHLEWRYFAPAELTAVQRRRVEDCLSFDGLVRAERF